MGKHARGVADAARTGWRVVRGWPGWRSSRLRALLAVGMLVAGAVPVVLVVNGDPGPALIELPRPLAGGPTAATTPTDPPTGVNEQPGSPHGAGPSVAGGGHYSGSSVVVSLRDPADTTPVTSRGATVVRELPGTGYIQVQVAGDPAALVAELRADPAVAEVDLDYGRHTTAAPNDPFYGQYQSNYLNLVRMPAAWDLLTDASSQVVAVVDTGVDAGHPDLVGRITGGYNAVAPGSPPSDVDGHGTFVAGVIAANANNGLGTAGVAWNGRVMPVKVFTGEFAYDSDTAAGIVWAVDHGARVVNLSLGGPDPSSLLQAAVRYATDRDVVVVAASGNEGDGTAQYPAAYPEVLAVGATDATGKLVDFSSYGDWLDLAAPGFRVTSTFPNGYATGDGTSFAAPMVAGVAALVRAQNPALTQAQVGDRLRAAARDAGPRGFDPYFGYGVLDAARALGAPFTADLPFPALGPGEPNDVPERAARIDPSSNPGASGTFAVEGDVDWFRYDVGLAQTMTVQVGGSGFNPSLGQNAKIVIDVFTGTGHAVANSQGPGLNVEWSGQVESGPVYIRVSNANGSADPRPYTVNVSGPPGIVGMTVEQRPFDTGPRAVGIGDLTGDGLVDVVGVTKVAFQLSPHDNKVFVLPQLPGGGLGDPIWLNPVQTFLYSVALTDVDRDGALDIVVGGIGGIEWFRQTAGGLTSQGLVPTAGGPCNFVTAADVDGDGVTDLVALFTGSNARIDILTHGAGSMFTASTIPDATLDFLAEIAVGDVDGDGRKDVVHTANGWVQVHRNTVGGWTHTEGGGAGPGPALNLRSVTVADVTGDGRDDVIATIAGNSPSGLVNVFRQNPDGTLAAPVWYDAHQIPQSVEAADLNGDGRTDVAVINSSWGAVTVLYQQADGTLGNRETSQAAIAQSPDGQGLAFGDVNHDGRQDIVSVADQGLNVLRRVSLLVRGGAVQTVTPVEHSTGAGLGTTPALTFATAMNPSTVDGSTVRLIDGRTGAAVSGAVSYNASSRTATITPSTPLQRAKPYRIVVSGVKTATAEPVPAFASTFTTTGTGPLAALSNFAVRGQLGVAAAVSAGVPIGDLGDVIVRYAGGSTAPASPTEGAAGYTGVGGGIMVGGLSPGQTYSFAVWYRDRAGNLSPRSTATLTGLTLTMTGVTADTRPLVPSLTFAGTVAIPAGPGVGVSVPLIARCADGPPAGVTAATATGNASGALSATLTLASPRCSFRWEITNSTTSMGAASSVVRGPTDLDPPSGPTTPRDR